MDGYSALSLLPPSALAFPLTYRWQVGTTWGGTSVSLTVDAPILASSNEAVLKCSEHLWRAVFAGASSILVSMVSCRVIDWKGTGGGFHLPEFPVTGMQPAGPSARSETAAVQLHSGQLDGLALRRFYFPGIPESWTDAGRLTFHGMRVLEQTVHAMMMGLQAPECGGPFTWYIAYENVEVPGTGEILPVGFRRVMYARLMHYTARAPDVSF